MYKHKYFTDKPRIEIGDLSVALKLNNLMLDDDEYLKIFRLKKVELIIGNVLTFYSVAKLFKLSTLSKLSLNYIERCLPMVVKN